MECTTSREKCLRSLEKAFMPMEQVVTYMYKEARERQALITSKRPCQTRRRCDDIEEPNKRHELVHKKYDGRSYLRLCSLIVYFQHRLCRGCYFLLITNAESQGDCVRELQHAVESDGEEHGSWNALTWFFGLVN